MSDPPSGGAAAAAQPKLVKQLSRRESNAALFVLKKQTEANARRRMSSVWATRKPGDPALELGGLRVQGETENVEHEYLRYSSLYCISATNPLRSLAVKVINNRWFNRSVLLLIILNSVVLMMTDYRSVDDQYKPVPRGAWWKDPKAEVSWPNEMQVVTEYIFTYAFLLECVLKIIGMGFALHTDAYLRDPWNVLDFVVVVSGFLAILPFMPNVSVLRTFRVLRPLRSITAFPALRALIRSLLLSLRPLLDVMVFIILIFVIFGILGVQGYVGLQHGRCRLTPFPMRLPENASDNDIRDLMSAPFDSAGEYSNALIKEWIREPSKYRCLPPAADGQTSSGSTSNQSAVAQHLWMKDAWTTPQDCIWPVDAGDEFLCGPGDPVHYRGAGTHRCRIGETCGSNYDQAGRPRFRSSLSMDNALFIGALNWGYTRFDNIGMAFVAIFQSITMEGWIDIAYQLQDVANGVAAAIFFVMLIMFASLFLLQLFLLIIWNNYEDPSDAAEEAAEDSQNTAGGATVHPLQPSNGGPDFDSKSMTLTVAPAGHTESRDAVRATARQSSESCFDRFARSCKWLVGTAAFNRAIVGFILLNTIVLAMDHYMMDDTLALVLEVINFILTLAFLVEMILKMTGLGIRSYLRDSFNVFDAIIVFVSLVELAAAPPKFMTGVDAGTGGISALRAFRILRILKLARNMPGLRILLNVLFNTVADVKWFLILLVLFIYIFALVGMEFFANRFRFDSHGFHVPLTNRPLFDATPPERHNFDSIVWAVTTVFQILSGENWNVVMYDAWRSSGGGSVVYFFALILVGDWILFNLFLALILSNFEGGGGNPELLLVQRQMTSKGKEGGSARQMFGREDGKADSKVGEAPPMTAKATTLAEATPKETALAEATPSGRWDASLFLFKSDSAPRRFCTYLVGHKVFDNGILTLIIISSILLAVDNPLMDPNGSEAFVLYVLDVIMTTIFTLEMAIKIIATGLIIGPGTYLRDGWNVLDGCIVLISILSLALAGNSSLNSLRTLRTLRALRPLRTINRLPNLKLVVRALLRSMSDMGYIVMVVAVVFLIFGILGVNMFKGAFQQCQGGVFEEVIAADPVLLRLLEDPAGALPIATAVAVSNGTPAGEWQPAPDVVPGQPADDALLFRTNVLAYVNSTQQTRLSSVANQSAPPGWAMLAAHVTGWTTASGFPETVTSQDVCVGAGASWERYSDIHFDDIFAAVSALFQITTTEGWLEVMYASVDAHGLHMQPHRDASPGWVLFYIMFVFIGAMFVMNLFVGVIIDNFNRMKDELGGVSALMTEEQIAWSKMQEIVRKLQPVRKIDPPKRLAFRVAYSICTHPWFDPAIMACIVFNTIVMMMTFFGESREYSEACEAINMVFAAIFTLEWIIKNSAMGLLYFSDGWNRFDFFIVLGTNIGILLKVALGLDIGPLASVVRTFRVGRVFRLVKRAKGLRQLFDTLILTLPALGNIGGLLLLIFFIFAVVGVNVFAKVQWGDGINAHANFTNFFMAFLVLCRCCTGEAWNVLMMELSQDQDGCLQEPIPYNPVWCVIINPGGIDDCSPLPGCGQPGWSALYFPLFTLLVTFIMLNLFVAVILEGFDQTIEDDDLSKEQFELFAEVWQEFDPHATTFINISDLPKLLNKLPSPMGMGEDTPPEKRDRFVRGITAAVRSIEFQEEEQRRRARIARGEDPGKRSQAEHALQVQLASNRALGMTRDENNPQGDEEEETVFFEHVVKAVARRMLQQVSH